MTLQMDFTRAIRPVKKVNGVGQPPLLGITDASLFSYLGDAHIPYSRLHDVGGAFGSGCYVDIPNVFPRFDADADDPKSYRFAHTDFVISELMKRGVEPVYRLGVTIENAVERYASPRLYPPEDAGKWAKVCEHIVRHYTQGWADGFTYPITYWEIWNEPDNSHIRKENQMWQGTREDYFRLYEVTANHLKKCFPRIKVGGPASCGFYALYEDEKNPRTEYFLSFFRSFLAYISSPEHASPLDFCSYHSYADIEKTRGFARYCRRTLDEFGFSQTETQLNEWNPSPRVFGLMKHAALVGGMLLMMQEESVDTAMFYDARIGISEYGSLFNPVTRKPYADYDAFVLFGRLRQLGTQVWSETDAEGIYACAATDGKRRGAMIASTICEDARVRLDVIGAKLDGIICEITDSSRRMEKAFLLDGDQLLIPGQSLLFLTFPETACPRYEGTLASASAFAACGRIEEWVHAYLNAEGNNPAFSEGLLKEKRWFYGPVRLPLFLLARVCGPEEGMRWRVDPGSFEEKVSGIMGAIRRGDDLPPMIAKWEGGKLELNDGNHRRAAYARLGIREASVILWGTGDMPPESP